MKFKTCAIALFLIINLFVSLVVVRDRFCFRKANFVFGHWINPEKQRANFGIEKYWLLVRSSRGIYCPRLNNFGS